MYCKKCGGKVESYASNCPFCGAKVEQNGVEATYTAPDGTLREHMSVGKWLLIFIAMAIPPINIILLVIWAFGNGTKTNQSFRNWARAQFVLLAIGLILSIVAAIILGPTIVKYAKEIYEQFGNLPNLV